jgi:hypothetical protein
MPEARVTVDFQNASPPGRALAVAAGPARAEHLDRPAGGGEVG